MAQAGGKRLIVLGGGLSGLCYVHYLRNFIMAQNKAGAISKITLVEANDYMGGSVKTRMFEDGIVHELGPRSIRSMGVRAQNTALLMEQLGLEDKLLTITSKSSAGQDRYIYDNNQLYKVPSSATQLFKKFPNSHKTLLGAVYRDMHQMDKLDLKEFPYEDPSIFDFVEHRFGLEVAEKVVDPVLRGITAGDARKLSTKALINDMLLKEQAYGSVLKGFLKPPVTKMAHDELFPNDVLKSSLLDKFQKNKVISYSLSTGLQTIAEHLSNSLLNTNDDARLAMYNQTRVEAINFNDGTDKEAAPCSVVVKTIDDDLIRIDGDHIVAAIPASDLAETLPKSMPEEQRQALSHVTSIEHKPVGCCVVEYRDLGKLPNVVDSFGFLTNSKAGSRVLGISFDSTLFPAIDKPHGSVRMTCMMGGEWWREIFQTDDINSVQNTLIEQISLDEIKKILKIEAEPHRMSPYLWKTGIAQYRPGHMERLQSARDEIKKLGLPLTLCGQSYDGVAINDVTFTARMAAYDFINSL